MEQFETFVEELMVKHPELISVEWFRDNERGEKQMVMTKQEKSAGMGVIHLRTYSGTSLCRTGSVVENRTDKENDVTCKRCLKIMQRWGGG